MTDKTVGPKWDITSRYYAVREDGVTVKYIFSGLRPFFVTRLRPEYGWLAGHKGRHPDSPRTFESLKGAMKAADKAWPMEKKDG